MQGRFGGRRRALVGLAGLAVLAAGCEIQPSDAIKVTPSTPGAIQLVTDGQDTAQIEVLPMFVGPSGGSGPGDIFDLFDFRDLGNGAVRLTDVESDAHPEIVLTARPAGVDGGALPANEMAVTDLDAVSFEVAPIAYEELPYVLLDIKRAAGGTDVAFAEREGAGPGFQEFRTDDAIWRLASAPETSATLLELLETGDTIVFARGAAPTGIRIGLGIAPGEELESFDGFVDRLAVHLADHSEEPTVAAEPVEPQEWDFEPDDVVTTVSQIPGSGWTGSGASIVTGADDLDELTAPSNGSLRLAQADVAGDSPVMPGWAGTQSLNGRSVADLGVLRYRTLVEDGQVCAEPSLLVGVQAQASESESETDPTTVPFIYHPCLEEAYYSDIIPTFPPITLPGLPGESDEPGPAHWRELDTIPGLISIGLDCATGESCEWPPAPPTEGCDPLSCGGLPLMAFASAVEGAPFATIAPLGEVMGIDFGDAGVVVIAGGDPLGGEEPTAQIAAEETEEPTFVHVDSLTIGDAGPGSTQTFDFAPGGFGGVIIPSLPTSACPVPMPLTFEDIDPDSVHAEAIACAASLGLAEGTETGLFEPDGSTTRAQMASFVARMLDHVGADLPEGQDAFGDDDGSVHEAAIDQLAAAGVVKGTSAITYSPDQPVSRAQMAALLIRAYELVSREDASGPDAFTDDDESVHEPDIDAAAALGIAEGVGGGLYHPNGDVRRDQMASFLVRTIDELIQGGHTTP